VPALGAGGAGGGAAVVAATAAKFTLESPSAYGATGPAAQGIVAVGVSTGSDFAAGPPGPEPGLDCFCHVGCDEGFVAGFARAIPPVFGSPTLHGGYAGSDVGGVEEDLGSWCATPYLVAVVAGVCEDGPYGAVAPGCVVAMGIADRVVGGGGGDASLVESSGDGREPATRRVFLEDTHLASWRTVTGSALGMRSTKQPGSSRAAPLRGGDAGTSWHWASGRSGPVGRSV